jgi:hypothetical protein
MRGMRVVSLFDKLEDLLYFCGVANNLNAAIKRRFPVWVLDTYNFNDMLNFTLVALESDLEWWLELDRRAKRRFVRGEIDV